MKRITTVLAAVIASGLMLAAVAGAAKPAPDAKDVAKATCKAEKQADLKAFKATYGKGAMRVCVKGEKDNASETINNASEECKAERDADPAAFAETYGTGKNGKNALGKCVSAKVAEDVDADVETFANAAQACRAEKQADPDAFGATYGSNKNGKNALGKCVSAKVKADEDAA
jgi:hypothetical protein